MNLEQSIKDFQAQNAGLQTIILNLAKGQDELKALLTKKTKTKKIKGVINMGKRFKGRPKRPEEAGIPKDEEEDNHNYGSQVGSDGQEGEEEEEPYDEDDSDEKYKLLEECLRNMEIQKVPGLDFDEMGLIPGNLGCYNYQLESANIRTWEDMATAFFRQYEYNYDLAPTRTQLQNMSMGPKESFKEYAQKWKVPAGRVRPALSDRELVDMFMGTLTGPFYSHLLGSSSSGFTELILTGEHVESGIRSGKIQVGTSSGAAKKPYQGKNESNVVHSQRGRGKNDQNQCVGAVLISTPTSKQAPRQECQRKTGRPRRKFTPINMPLSQALQHLLKAKLVTLKDHPKFVNTASPNYDPKATCAYHSNATGHNVDNCWALRNKVQDMIEAGEIEFEALENPNVITAPMTKHDKTVNAIMDTIYIRDVRELSTPLLEIKRKLIQASLFPGCDLDCYYCARLPNDCENLKRRIQKWMDRRTIMFEKIPSIENLYEGNIAGISKVTRSGRVFSPEISPNNTSSVVTITPSADARGKGPFHEPEAGIGNSSSEDTNEFLKIIRKTKDMKKFLEDAHVPQEISVNQLKKCIENLTTENYLGFSDADLSPSGKNHNKALHISIECGGTTLAHVLVDNGSSMNVLPKLVLDKLRPEGAMLKYSDVIVKAFDGSMSTVHGEIELPIRVGKIVTVHGEEEYVVSFIDETKYVEFTIEGFETPRQAFELVPQVVSETKPVKTVPKVTRIPPTMASLKDARAVVEEGGCTIWGQLPDILYKSDKWGLGCTAKDTME
ncbi:uncharacterized protein LOC131648479 [Vicia villosa]|uniref:uncharacterized protein LOC131648479 n=1 Tax=Vicia villosa TaxID=3911 RepID=UPI00273B7B89|nr:uncharacterized protein LOC131648479 [Vicia villosa]